MPYSLTLPNGTVINNIPDNVPRGQALENLKAKMPDAFPAPPGVGEQLLGLPAEIGKGFIRGLTVDPASGIASLGYTGARAAGAELTPFEQTGVGKGLASAQRALAPSDEGLITQFGGGLGSLLSFIPGGLLKGGVGLATKLTQAGGVGSEEARARAEEARVMGEADATAGQQFMAQLGGTGVGLTELAPLKFLTEPIEQILRGVPKSQADLIAPTLFNSGKRMLATGGIEGFQEGMANIAQDLIAKGIYNPNLQVGESALGDAAMGASVGAFAQGAIELATRGKRRALYEQFKEQEEAQKQAEAQRIAAEQQALIDAQERQQQQLAMQALGGPQIDPATGQPVLLLGGPAPQVNLQDPLGIRFGEEDLGPKIVRGINRARKEKGLPPTKQFTVEDLMEAGTEKDAPFVSEMLARKTGFDPSVQVSPQSVLEVAQSKNIDVESPGFTDFLRRTTGSADIGSMTAPQLFAAQQSLSALPNFTEPTQLPTGSQATTFDDKTYKKTVDGLKKTVLNSGPLGRSQVIEEIKGFSGLTETRDAERLLETALGRGDLSASPTKGLVGTSINISLPTLPGIGGPDVRRGDYMDSEVTGYEITSEDGKFKQVRPTMTAAENSLAAANESRLNAVTKLTDEANRTQLVLESNQEKLAELEQVGETGAQYKKIESNIKNLTSKLNRLNDKIQSASQPLQIKARQTPRSRAGFTLFENGQPVGTYPTQEDAQIAAVRFRTDEELDGIINAAPRTTMEGALEQPFGEQPVQRGTVRSGMARRLYDEAVKEKDRRYRTQAGLPPPAAPVQIKITGDAVAAAERLRAAGLTVRFAPEVEKEVPEINKRLRAVLDRLGLKDVRLNIVESMKVPGFAIYDQRNQLVGFIKQVEPSSPDYAKNMATLQSARASGMRVEESVASANGSYAAKLIEIALDSENPIRAARHEAIHALKELGFFTPDQWRVLENKAKSEWIKTYQIESRYSDLDQEGRIEEAIADAFSDFDQNKPPVGTIGNLFRKVKAFFEALGNAFRGSGFQTADQVFTRVEEGRLTGPGAAVAGKETQYSLGDLQQYVTPEAAEGVLRRRAARAEGFGAPINERVVIGKGDDVFAVGKITPSDWLKRVEETMKQDEVVDARNWYQQLRDVFEPLFGPKASEYSLAWLLSQQRASPTKGFTDVLRASDIAQNKLRIKKAGLNEKALVSALRGEVPEGGIGSKLLDFIDSEMGRTTRTVVRGAPEGRQPAAIDVWAQRDIGFVDDVIKKFVAKKYGKEAADKLEIDTARFGEPQYEYGVDFYNNVAEFLNQQNYLGGGWTASEVQAVGWVNMQKFVGVTPEFVRDIIGGNTRRISLGLAPGAGGPMVRRLMGKEIPVAEAKKVIDELATAANVKVTQTVDGVGAYLTYVEGSIQLDAIGSPESVQDFMDMVGYVFQQTEMISTRPLASGKNSAIDIVSPSLNTQDKAIKFFTEYLNAMPKDSSGDPIAPGFQQIKVDGVPGIRLINFGGKWNKKQIEALAKAAEVAEKATGIKDAVFTDMNVQFTSAKNDWVKYPDGDQYVNSLRNRGRLQETELLQREFPPARFDLAGDGSINWRARLGYEPKLSIRLDELVGGPGIGGGISIREQQPTAQSFDAVHYGKQPVNTLLGSMYGTGIRGAEAQRVFASEDPRVQQRAYFYIPLTNGRMPMPEAGLGNQVHVQRLNNLLGPGPEMQALVDATRGPDGRMDANAFESAVIDAGYDGYAVPDMGMAVVLGADVPVISRGTRQEVEAMPEEGKIQIGDRKYSLRPIETPEFKQWFGESKIVNADSTPKVMYHGTARDIETFIPKRADAIFITDRPRFAEGFADSSEDYMIGKYMESATPEQTSAIIEKAIAKGLKDKDILPSAAKSLRDMNLDQASRTVGVGDYIRELVKNELPSGQNIMPLYVRAENPFDYENPQHIRRLAIAGIDDDVTLEEISEGDWEAIESPEVQEVIRDLFDSFYIKEGGVKNLAVYDPNQIKSAIGNIGTFSRTNDDIRYSIALGSLEPRTALIPDLGGNPDGNLGSAPDKFDSKPIRMTVGTHNDIDDKGYGANHILTRVMSDPNRMADLDMSVKEVLERILVTAQKTAQNYSRIYRDPKTKHLAFYTPKNTLIVSQDRDQLSIVSMFKVDKPDQKFGQPLWQGRAPVVPQFVGKIRGTEVEAREGRVQPKAKTEVSVKPKRVYTPTEIEQIAAGEPTKGTLSLKKKMSLAGLTPTDSKDNMIYLLQDKNIDLKRVIQAIQKSGKDLADRWNAYLQEELFHGRSATRVRFFMDRELRPFLQKMEAANVSVEQMDDYLLARHAKEANAYLRRMNADPSQNSGMTDKEAEDYMASLPPQRRMTLERLAKEVDAFTKGTRDLMVDYGLEDRKTINQWEKTYKNYVPLFREEVEDGLPISIGRGYQIRGATTRRRMGSSRKVSDILANIALQRERTIVRGEKNRVGNSLYGLILDNPNKGFWGVINPEKTSKQALRMELLNMGIDPNKVDEMVAIPPRKTINKKTGLVAYEVPPLWKDAENIFATRINGEDRFMIFNKNDERAMRMASTLKNLDAQQQGEAVRMMGTAGDYYRKMIDGTGKVTRYFAQINTQYNPAFGIYNLMRDIGGAVLNLQTTPLKGQEAKVISDALVALKSVYRDLRRQREGLDADSEWAKIFEEFELEGGKTGYRDLFETRESRAEALQKEIEDFNKGTVRSKGKAVMGWLSDFNDAIENSIRVSVYKNAIDKGISKERAASLAKNITVNFNRTGAVSRNFQTLFAFFNASIQGTARIAQTLLTSEGKLSPTGKKIVMGGITLGLMQAVLLAMAGLDDDEVPDFVKDKSFVIPTGDGKYIAIPMPLGYNIIPGFGRRVMEFAMSDDKNVGKAVAETSQMIVDGFNPLGSGTFVQTLTPTALDPIVALAENKDFTGKPISREDINSLSPTPGYTRGSQNSFAVTEALAYAINILSGGTEFKKGVLSPTPDQIEYLVGEALGGVGREAMKIGRGVEAIATGEELATYNIPIAGRLVGNVQQQAAQRNRFFENIRRLNEHQAEIEGRMLNGEDINDYLETFPEATMYQVGDKVYNQITKLRQQRKALEAAGVGKEELKVIDEAVLGLMTSLNEIYSSAKQQ